MEPEPDELVDMIAYALWRHWKLRPARRDLAAMRVLAQQVVEHLALCRIEWRQKPPGPRHGTSDY